MARRGSALDGTGGNRDILRPADYQPPNMGPIGGCSPQASILLSGSAFDPCAGDETYHDPRPNFVPKTENPCVTEGPDSYNQYRRYPGAYDNLRRAVGYAEAERVRNINCRSEWEWIYIALVLTGFSVFMWVS